MKCGTIVLCAYCSIGDHMFCDGNTAEACDEHYGEYISCKCHCMAHPDNREAVKERNKDLGLT